MQSNALSEAPVDQVHDAIEAQLPARAERALRDAGARNIMVR
jgi:hypothetical protein